MRHKLIAAFPIVEQLRGGPSRLMVRDLTAGITVAALLVPQGMAYAELAGLPRSTDCTRASYRSWPTHCSALRGSWLSDRRRPLPS